MAVALLTLVWFASHFAPGAPRSPEPEQGRSSWSIANSSFPNPVQAETIVDIPFGTTYRADAITMGKKFLTKPDYIEAMDDEAKARTTQSPGWEYNVGDFSLSVGEAKVVPGEAFGGFYPHYVEANQDPNSPLQDSVFFLIEVTATNTTDTPTTVPIDAIFLWSDTLFGANDQLFTGIGQGKYLLKEFFGTPQDDFLSYKLSDDWNILEPSETAQWTFAYCVNKGLFTNPEDLENIDLSKFCLTIGDWDPPTIYRLWLK